MKKRILLYNDNSKRDLLGIRLIEEELKKLGYKTKICNPDNLKPSLFTMRPHAFIASRADASSPVYEISKFSKIFIVPGEGGQQTKETILSVFMGRSYFKLKDVSWITRCYLWGFPTYEWLLEAGLFKKNQLLVTGNSRIDIYRNKKFFNKKEKKIFTIGVAFSSKSTSTYYGDLGYHSDYFNENEKAEFPIAKKGRFYEDIMWRDHAILRIMMQTIKKILNDFDKINIILRPSPFENPKAFKFLEKKFPGKIRILDQQTLPDFINNSDVLLTCWSTTGLEALINNKPVISIYGFMDEEHLFQHISKKASGFETYVQLYHNPKSYEKLKEMLFEAMQNKLPASRSDQNLLDYTLKQLYNWPNEIPASKLIAEDIDKVFKEKEIDDVKIDRIKKIFPSKYPIPIFLKPLAHNFFAYIKYFRSGAFRSFYGFRKIKDYKIEKLVKSYFEK